MPLDYAKHIERNPLFRPNDTVRLEGSEVVHVPTGRRVPRTDGSVAAEPIEATLDAALQTKVGAEVRLGDARFVNLGRVWEEHAQMLDWLGVSLHVSSWKRDAAAEAASRASLAVDNPLETEDPAAVRVHEWLCGRLRSGYHQLAGLLEELDALDHEYSPHQAEPRRLCVSLCGSQRTMLQTRGHMAQARSKLRGDTAVSYELAADYHG